MKLLNPNILRARLSAAITACAMTIAIPTAGADDCGFKPLSQIGGTVDSVALSGSRAVFHQGPRLVIADIANAFNPTVLGTMLFSEQIYDIEAAGNYAYIAAANAGLQIVSFAVPSDPWVIGSFESVRLYDIELNGQFLYAAGVDPATYETRLYTFNILNPAQPQLLGSFVLDANRIRVFGNRLYACGGEGGIVAILSLQNPASPVQVGGISAGAEADDIAVSGNYAFVAAGTSGVKVYEVSNPGFVVPSGSYANAFAFEIAISGTRAFVGSAVDMIALNISTPGSPTLLGTYAPGNFYPHDVVPFGNYVVAAAGTRLHLVTVANPASMSPAGTIHSGGYAMDVENWGNRAYVATDGGLQVLNMSDPGQPSLTNNLVFPGSQYPIGVTRSGLFAYVGHTAGLRIYSLQNPDAPALLSDTDIGWSSKPTVVGNMVYVPSYLEFTVVNAINPSNPTVVGSCSVPSYAAKVAVSGTAAYVSTSQMHFHVINVANPASPTIVATLNTPSWIGGLAVQGGYLYVGDTSGISVYTLANPLLPALVTHVDSIGSFADELQVVGDRLYAARGFVGVETYDISNPAAPVFLKRGDTPRYAHELAFFGSAVLVADNSGGLFVMREMNAADTNCDGSLNAFDIQPFTVALSDAETYAEAYPFCDPCTADANGDGSINSFDIQAFIDTMAGAP